MTHFTPVAENLGGSKTWKFNQAKPSQWTKRLGTGTLGGICWAASVAYIVGESTSDSLQAKVGSNGNINCSVYNKLVKLQAANMDNQNKAQAGIFVDNGLTADDFNMTSGAKANGDGPMGVEIAQMACRWDNCWVMVSVNWKDKKTGHAMAFAMARNDYRLFDSNSGEYTFPTKSGFKQFVAAYFNKNSMLSSIQKYALLKVS